MQSFLFAIASKNESTKFIISGAKEAFDSHLYVFAAEHSRRTEQVVKIEKILKMAKQKMLFKI